MIGVYLVRVFPSRGIKKALAVPKSARRGLPADRANAVDAVVALDAVDDVMGRRPARTSRTSCDKVQ